MVVYHFLPQKPKLYSLVVVHGLLIAVVSLVKRGLYAYGLQ